MCGFLGEIATHLQEKDSFKILLDLSIHRGPDQQAVWKDENCQLGFNRLAIIDLSENGKQPLISPSGKFAMVFNGEVYNYKEIQIKYNISDEDLRSSSDTEILSHLLEKTSILEFASELNGMFAISIWDISKKELYLIRDFAGIKPLFYGLNSDGIVFASQFDQIFQHPFFNTKKLRPEIMKEYFGLGYMQAPNTVFENIYQLEPGQIITWNYDEKKITSKDFFYHWSTTNTINETSEETVTQLKKVFSKVIKSQLNADVPVATFLSGGIDSSLVTAFSKQNKDDIQSYTFGILDKNYDESKVAQLIAKQLQVNHCIEKIHQNEILEIVNQHFEKYSEPFGDESTLPTYLITQKAKQFATVMLSGDGGDELFWGYPRFLRSIEQLHWFKLPLIIRKIVVPLFRKNNIKLSSALNILNRFEDWILYKQIHFYKLDNLFPNVFFSKELNEIFKFNNKLSKKEALLYLKKNEFYAHLQKVLRKVDLMSMANSLEVRVPFLDKEMINFSNTISPEYGIKHNTSKFILRKLLFRFVDKKITELPKKGFSVPIESWLKNELKQDVFETIKYKPIYGSENFDNDFLKEILDDYYSKNIGNSWGIWHIYAWQKWATKYNLV